MGKKGETEGKLRRHDEPFDKLVKSLLRSPFVISGKAAGRAPESRISLCTREAKLWLEHLTSKQ